MMKKYNHKKILITLIIIITILFAVDIIIEKIIIRQYQKENRIQTKQNALNKETDNRILLTPQNINQYNTPPNCEKFNSDPANTYINYTNSTKGISVKMPYNSSWGNEKFRINPYDETENEISFGPISTFEACSWTRSYFIEFKPAKTAEEVIASLPAELKPIKITINNLSAIKYIEQGLCTYSTLEIVGEKYNYEFSPLCGSEAKKEFEFLENIIKTIKLIK